MIVAYGDGGMVVEEDKRLIWCRPPLCEGCGFRIDNIASDKPHVVWSLQEVVTADSLIGGGPLKLIDVELWSCTQCAKRFTR